VKWGRWETRQQVGLGQSGPLIWRDWTAEMDVWLVGGYGAGTYGLTASRARDGWWRGCKVGLTAQWRLCLAGSGVSW
jgi:hypothetical protein